MATNRLPEPKSKPTEQTNAQIIVLEKGDHHWVFMYRDSLRVELLRQLGRMAADPELDFHWWDSAVVSKLVRETAPK